MAANRTVSRLAGAALILAAVEFAGLVAVNLALTQPAQAQLFERRQRGGGGFLGSIFGNPNYGGSFQGSPSYERPQPQVDYSRAPPAKKSEGTPTVSVMVLGDSMADWLGYGLEEAFADAPEFGVLRRAKARSGLLRYDAKSDLDWWHVVRDEVAKDKVDYVVIMLGINDRQSIRETQAERAAEKEKKDAKAGKDKADKAADANKSAKADDDKADPEADDNDIVAPEPKRGNSPGVIEFRTEKWEEVYGKRIDEMIAGARSKGVPVLWVGLPPIRGTRSTADTVYLNDLYRAHAEKAGIAYVDIWEGFVDEAGKFTSRGPDFEGQIRLLRANDGVHFTKSGARKVAHYVERELRRIMSNRSMPVAMPSGGTPAEQTPEGQAAGPAVRPAAGPVVPLTADSSASEELLGGASTRPVHSDPTATRVLVKGEPVASVSGRADDFSWPRPEDPNAIEPLSPTAAAARAEPAPAAKVRPGAKTSTRDAKDSKAEKNAKPAKPAAAKPKPVAENPPRPRQPVRQADRPPPSGSGLGGVFR